MTNRMRQVIISLLVLGLAWSPSAAWCGTTPMANGLGFEVADDVGTARAMGGVGIANADGINLLRGNPALISAVSRYTFGFGASYISTDTKISGTGSDTNGLTDSEMLMIAVPVTRGIVIGWGLRPFTRTNVHIKSSDIQNGEQTTDTISITGGINTSSSSIAWSYRGLFRIGYSMNYHFGTTQEEWSRTFPGNDGLIPTSYYLKKRYGGYSHTLGAIASIGDIVSLGFGYTTETTLTNDNFVVPNSLENDNIRLDKESVKLPAQVRFGMFAQLNENLGGGIDITYEPWEDAALSLKEQRQYSDVIRIGTGFRFVPGTRQTDPYWKRMPISVGLKYATLYYKSYPVVDAIVEKAFTCGIELPFKNEIGSLATSLEVGTRGTQNANGWSETYMGFSLSLIGRMQ